MSGYQTIKRGIDFIAALALGIAFSWLLILICLGYVVTFNFPVLFKQMRTGKDGVPFLMLKFRTLATDAGKPAQQRRFFWGDLIRSTSLDELPQLWNVLTGDMSLIGPRPLPVSYASLMSREQQERHAVRPGITGYAQVNGRHAISWTKKFELDLYYIHNLSFALDVRILFKTIVLLLSFSKDVSLSEEPFKGN